VTTAEPDATRDVVLVLHPQRRLFLTCATGRRGAPELWARDRPPDWPHLLAAAREFVPDGVWPLGPGRRVAGVRVHIVQARSPVVTPGYSWIRETDQVWPQQVRRAVRAALDEDGGRTPIPALRAPWMRRDWWIRATDWVDAELATRGRSRSGDLEPREHWRVSAVARVPTTDGAVWLKAVPPIFGREPAVLDVLGERLAGRVPRVLARQESAEGSRFLTDDAGTVPADIGDADPARLGVLLADFQLRTLDLLPRLAAVGCADRSPARLAAGLEMMAYDGVEVGLLDPDERTALQQQVPRITDHLLALAQTRLPPVLVHGDFHPWNVARRPGWAVGDAVALDWTDAAIGPVGIDLIALSPRSTDEPRHTRVAQWVRQEYAAVWAARLGLPLHEVSSAVAAAVPAAHIMQALAYDEILRATEPQAHWELAGVMARHLRALLAGVPAAAYAVSARVS
jgi:hypothetical protein